VRDGRILRDEPNAAHRPAADDLRELAVEVTA
jgi:hypothetical protein